jgi:protein TonB
MIAAIKLPQREPVRIGVLFSIVFHAVLVAALLVFVHPHLISGDGPRVFPKVIFPATPDPLKVIPPMPRLPPPAAPQRLADARPQTPAITGPVIGDSFDIPPADTSPRPDPATLLPETTGGVGTSVPPAYYNALQALIRQSLVYPRHSMANEEEGGCRVRVDFGRDGLIRKARVVQSSGFASLDGECQDVFLRIERFPAVPAETSAASGEFQIELPISFALR